MKKTRQELEGENNMNKQKFSRKEQERYFRQGIWAVGIVGIIGMGLFLFFTLHEYYRAENLQSKNSQLEENISNLNSQLNITKLEIKNNLSFGLYCDNGFFLEGLKVNDSAFNALQNTNMIRLIYTADYLGIRCEVLK